MSRTEASVGTSPADRELAEASKHSRIVDHVARLSTQRRRRWWRDSVRRRMLALADGVAALLGSVPLAVGATAGNEAILWSLAALPLWILLAKLYGLYDRDHRVLRHLTVDEVPAVLAWALTGTGALMLLVTLAPAETPSLATAIWVWLVAAASALLLRGTARYLWRRLTLPERTLLVGSGPLLEAARRKLELFSDMHVSLIGERAEITVEDLEEDAHALRALDRVIVASQAIDEALIAMLVRICRREQIKLSVIPPARGMFGTAVNLHHVADLPVVQYNTWDVSRTTLFLKRALDVGVALMGLLLLTPLFALCAVAVRLESSGSIFFVQRRAGLYGRPFRMYKFRTMVSKAEDLLVDLVPFDRLPEPVFKLENDPRVTRVGRLLRRYSLDELPQLLNVLNGEMSLVGPRPEQVELVERYGPEGRIRLALRPGMTGPMQVFGRGRLDFEERLAVEREYIENLSLARDLKILAMTIPAVFMSKGAF
jgi:exopolysaccharide biosynthesis polyprenyl glycosylphosphotransferase